MGAFDVRDGRLVDPDGNPFLSLGINHADETSLQYPHNLDVWKRKYGSREAWIRDGVLADFRGWAVNTIGWTREYVAGGWGEALDWFGDPIDLYHSLPWTSAELRGAGMPYVAQMQVQDIEDWNGHPAFRPLDDEFTKWCDYVARAVALQHAESETLLGYFFVDIPAWLPHASGRDFPELVGLDGAARATKLYDVASRYYETMVTAIRRYDPDHLVLGDRYNGDKGIPEPVLRAMAPFVDVVSVQRFAGPTEDDRTRFRDDLAGWSEQAGGKPVLVADHGNWTATPTNPQRVGLESHAARGEDYGRVLDAVRHEPWFAGLHWCGYVENLGRGWGVKDPHDEPYRDLTDAITEHNRRALAEHGTHRAESSA